MRRFFDRGEPDQPPGPERARSEEWQFGLTPARPPTRPEDRTPGEPAPPVPFDRPEAEMPPPDGVEDRIGLLIAMTRAFRDGVAERLELMSARIDGLTVSAAQQRTATESALARLEQSVGGLESEYSSLSSDLMGLSQRLSAVLTQLVDYDLKAASTGIASGIDELREHLADRAAGLEETRAKLRSEISALLSGTVDKTNDRLTEVGAELERVSKELSLLRRRITLTAK